MSKGCQNCGKKQTVEINQKKYCANCGELHSLVPTATPKPAPSPSEKPALAKPGSLPHLLDLSTKIPPKTSPHRPAQSVHGQRKDRPQQVTAPEASLEPPIKKVEITSRSQQHHARAKRAKQYERHPKVERFTPARVVARSKTAQDRPHIVPTQPMPMAPHHIYQINSLDEVAEPKSHLAQQITEAEEATGTIFARIKDNLKFLTRRRHIAPLLAGLAVVVLLAGYITYLNVPSISVRLAASRAGLEVQLPNYRPPGFALNKLVDYSQGQITVRFSAGSSRDYVDLTQRRTQWDPQTLLENYVNPKGNSLDFHQNGLTVYIYNGNDAAWINNGFFYTLEGDNQLDQGQILKMAASL